MSREEQVKKAHGWGTMLGLHRQEHAARPQGDPRKTTHHLMNAAEAAFQAEKTVVNTPVQFMKEEIKGNVLTGLLVAGLIAGEHIFNTPTLQSGLLDTLVFLSGELLTQVNTVRRVLRTVGKGVRNVGEALDHGKEGVVSVSQTHKWAGEQAKTGLEAGKRAARKLRR